MTATARAADLNTRARGSAITLVTDAAHWAGVGVHTGEDLDQYLAWQGYLDTYKETRGFRPGGAGWRARTAAEWAAATAAL
jgi:hypothetical protein